MLHLQSPSGGFINNSCVYLVALFYPFMIFPNGGLADQRKALRTARAESSWDVLGLLDAKRGGSTRPLLVYKSTSVVFPPFLLSSFTLICLFLDFVAPFGPSPSSLQN